MKKQLPAWAVLCIIALVAGLMLGATNELTAERILEQGFAAADTARRSVLPAAREFELQELPEDSNLDNCYAGLTGGELQGYTAQATVKGYGGDIEVIVGMNAERVITGINVGGPGFAETAGLGAKTKDAAFTEQFRGLIPPVVLGQNVDGVSAATISSSAVIMGVGRCVEYIQGLLAPEAPAEEEPVITFTNLVEQPAADGIDAWWTADEGRVVQASAEGYGGAVTAIVSIYSDGTIAGVVFEAPDETESLGGQVMSQRWFAAQFAGQSGQVAADTITGASISSDAAIAAVQAALNFEG